MRVIGYNLIVLIEVYDIEREMDYYEKNKTFLNPGYAVGISAERMRFSWH